jgi:hypothetical protein
MDMTLNQYLADVDRWKTAVQSELDALTIEEQRARLLLARRQIEDSLELPFPELPATHVTS